MQTGSRDQLSTHQGLGPFGKGDPRLLSDLSCHSAGQGCLFFGFVWVFFVFFMKKLKSVSKSWSEVNVGVLKYRNAELTY